MEEEKPDLKKIYKDEYDKIYYEERAKFLKEQAEVKAKEDARKPQGIGNLIKEFLGGGRP